MKKKVIMFLLTLSVIQFSLSCDNDRPTRGSADSPASSTQIKQEATYLLSPELFEEKYNSTEGAVLLDVRTPGEYNSGTIKGSSFIEFNSADFQQRLDALDREGTYFLFCHSGGRSRRTQTLMNQMGFKNVFDLQGGITAWKRAGKPVVIPK